MDLFFCMACAALYSERSVRCVLCSGRVAHMTENVIRQGPYTVAAMLAATQRAVEMQSCPTEAAYGTCGCSF